jgi:hypothetical protein
MTSSKCRKDSPPSPLQTLRHHHECGGDKIENCMECGEDIHTPALVTCQGCVEWR